MRTLQSLLRDRGRLQRDLAEVLGVSEPSVSRWANREADIPAKHIHPIASFLAVPAVEVLDVATRISDADVAICADPNGTHETAIGDRQ